MNIILFGGGFDPIHKGHINMAELASIKFDADVIFIPAVVSVWKDKAGASFEDRLEMINLAINDNPRFKVSDYENTTGETTNYSFETVQYFKKEYPNDKLFLLIGQDQVNSFHEWKKADYIAENVQIIYFKRPNYEESIDNINKYHMIGIEGELKDVSSSEVRKMEKLDETPFEVVEYIGKNHLYYAEELYNMLFEQRYAHSLEVAKLAYQIALSNKLDNPSRAYIAGLLHDCAKSIKKRAASGLIIHYYREYAKMPFWSYHQFIGALLAKTTFNVKDEEILDAIRYHATGKANMTPLGMIIYAADKIEPTRGYDSKDMIEACLKDYKAGFLYVLDENRKYLIQKGKDYKNKLTVECFNCYLNNWEE